jgi:hypothetical protein
MPSVDVWEVEGRSVDLEAGYPAMSFVWFC